MKLTEKQVEILYRLESFIPETISFMYIQGGCFSQDTDFTVYQEDNGEFWMVPTESVSSVCGGIMVKLECDWSKPTPTVDEFWKRLRESLVKEELVVPVYSKFKNYEYIKLGDGRYDVAKNENSCRHLFIRAFEYLPEDLKEHIIEDEKEKTEAS
jgi:hypothetical protein